MNAGGEALPDIGCDDVSLIENYQDIYSFIYKSSENVTVTTGMTNAEVFKTQRLVSSDFALEYKIPVPAAGVYTVDTLFSEGFYIASGDRVQNMHIDGTVTNAGCLCRFWRKEQGAGTKELGHQDCHRGNFGQGCRGDKSNPFINGINIQGCSCDGAACPTTMTPTPEPVKTSPEPGAFFVKMNVGGPALPVLGYTVDNTDVIVGPTTGFAHKSLAGVKVPAGEKNIEVYKTERYSKNTRLTYKFKLPAGTDTVETLHAESFFAEAGKRWFGVKINGVPRSLESVSLMRSGRTSRL